MSFSLTPTPTHTPHVRPHTHTHTVCQYTSHKRCIDSILGKCTGADTISDQSKVSTRSNYMYLQLATSILLPTHVQYLKERFKIDMPHRFKKYTFLGPTFCDMCGQLMHGIFRQQLKCEGESNLQHKNRGSNFPPYSRQYPTFYLYLLYVTMLSE